MVELMERQMADQTVGRMAEMLVLQWGFVLAGRWAGYLADCSVARLAGPLVGNLEFQ